MGCSSSCHIFKHFNAALEWIVTNKFGIISIIHCLDDFLILGPPNSDQCHTDLNNFLSMCEHIGVPIKAEKAVQSSNVIIFLGIELDSVSKIARLPQAKLIKIQNVIENLMAKTCFFERHPVTYRLAELCLPGHYPWEAIRVLPPFKISCLTLSKCKCL